MLNTSVLQISKYKDNYLVAYIVQGGLTYCYQCAIEDRYKIITEKLLWNSLDLGCRCDKCKRKIEDVQ